MYYGGSRYTAVGVQISRCLCLRHCTLLISFYSVFEYTYLLFWNSFWTLAPVIGIGLFDRVIGEQFNDHTL